MPATTTAKARELLGDRRLIFALNHVQTSREDWDTFRQLAELAVEAGGTHLHIGQFPYRHDNWVLPDNSDPYACWSNTSTPLLRVCPPESLQEWVSPDHAAQCQDFIHRQLEIMRPYGLKGFVSAIEPHWLPEGVYRAHPRWRGAQCELGRIARRPYFAPSIDEPEVLDLYRQAARRFGGLFPEADYMEFMSNDSGGGVAWTPCIYPGMNGPAKYRLRDGGARIADWLHAIQDGANDSGVDLRLHLFSSGFPADLKASTQAKLRPNVFCCWSNPHDEKLSSGSAKLGGSLWTPTYPAVGLGNPDPFLQGLQAIYHNPDGDNSFTSIYLHEAEFALARKLLQLHMDNPAPGRLPRLQNLLAAGAWLAGDEDAAETLADCWDQIQNAMHAIAQIRQKGFGSVFNFCTVSSRWLIRPLVPEPEALTPEETAYYRDYILAAGDEKDDPNFGLVLGKAVFNGESVTWMSRWCLHEAIGTLRGVRGKLEALADQLTGDGAERVRLLARRVGALTCMALNARHCILYKYALDIAHQPQYGPNQMDYDDNIIYDQRALNLRKIAREEVDNTAELIELLESTDEVLIETAGSPDEESVFRLGPDLVDDLRRKLDIMLDHWQDYERLYPATKVWDFEPEPVGNLDIQPNNETPTP